LNTGHDICTLVYLPVHLGDSFQCQGGWAMFTNNATQINPLLMNAFGVSNMIIDTLKEKLSTVWMT